MLYQEQFIISIAWVHFSASAIEMRVGEMLTRKLLHRHWRETDARKQFGKTVVEPQEVLVMALDAARQLLGLHLVHSVHTTEPGLRLKASNHHRQLWRLAVPPWTHLRGGCTRVN